MNSTGRTRIQWVSHLTQHSGSETTWYRYHTPSRSPSLCHRHHDTSLHILHIIHHHSHSHWHWILRQA